MKNISHWTPGYVVARGREMADHKLRPNDPWLTREAIGLLDRLLRPSDVALEFGSGRSSRWFARKVAKITSVEHDAIWHQMGVEKIKSEGIVNIDLILRPRDVADEMGSRSSYVRVLDGFADQSLDFVLVDGVYRNHCALGAISKVKAGGILAIDNVNWYLPSASLSPTSRSMAQGPVDATWQEFADNVRDWRRIWTSSGVTDTAIMFKP